MRSRELSEMAVLDLMYSAFKCKRNEIALSYCKWVVFSLHKD